jgi:antitoxin VapB
MAEKGKRAVAKVFKTGRSQAVRIPKEYRFACDEVFIEKEAGRIILTPRPRTWREYFERAPRFGDDYPNDIEELPPQEREPL